jgi:large subunit ribosomal protein L15
MSVLSSIKSIQEKSKRRVGRGFGSQKGGHTSGRGQKGQKSRRGSKIPLWFEGGQLPLIKRLPMLRGKARFNVLTLTAEVSLSDLDKMQADTITFDTLKLEKVIPARAKKAKIIATGKLRRKIAIEGIQISAKAKEALENAGGTVKDITNE